MNPDTPIHTAIKPAQRAVMDSDAKRSVSVKIIQLVIMHLVIVTVCRGLTASSAMMSYLKLVLLVPVLAIGTRPKQTAQKGLVLVHW